MPTRNITPLHRLNILLLKENVTSFDQALKDKGDLSSIEVPDLGVVYVRSPHSTPPKWLKYFNPIPETAHLGLTNRANAVLLFVRVDNRILCLCFGYGRSYLAPGSWEERFGLRVTLNSVDHLRIKSIDKRTFDALGRRSREQPSKETSADSFGLDVERDLLRAVTGVPRDTSLGKSMTGTDALGVSVRITPETTVDILRKYLAQFNAEDYKEHFGWVDHLGEVTSSEVKTRLDDKLVEALRGGAGNDRVWMAPPDMVDWERGGRFQYSKSARAPYYEDIGVDEFLRALQSPGSVSVQLLKQRSVFLISNEDDQQTAEWPVYQCLYFECELDGFIFILSDGKWYRIDRDYVVEVKREIAEIPEAGMQLPAYNDESEAAYNKRVVQEMGSAAFLFDRKPIIHGGGRSSVEVCDILTSDKAFVHVKRYSGSSGLSHLFEQGMNAGELFMLDEGFRKKINDKVSDSFKRTNPESKPAQEEYAVVFGIISTKSTTLELPFFSQLSLKAAAKRLKGLGLRISYKMVKNERPDEGALDETV